MLKLKFLSYFIAFTILTSLFSVRSEACSSFFLKDGDNLLFGNNFDFPAGTARVLINKRGVSKTAFAPPSETPMKWTSKYGSITFNQVGWDFPYQGMNEAGLVVAQMWFDGTKVSAPDQRGAITELQWVQYQLDTAQTVEEVIASDTKIRIMLSKAPLHYLVSDRMGKAAAIEFIDGKLVVNTENGMPYPVLTNNAYSEAAAFTAGYQKDGRLNEIPKTEGMSERFGRAAAMLINYKNQKPAVDYAFDILKNVSAEATKYSIVFDNKNGKINYKTKNNQKIRSLQMQDFDFSCKSPVLGVDIENEILKGIDDFQTYTINMNRILIEKIITECDFLNQAVGPVKEFYINYPQSFICDEKAE